MAEQLFLSLRMQAAVVPVFRNGSSSLQMQAAVVPVFRNGSSSLRMQAAVVPVFRNGSSAFMSNCPSLSTLNHFSKVLNL